MTAHRSISTLRFEEADLPLGDELRGARASSGRSLDQIERELRIKAAYLLAIEDARPDLLPDPAYAAGFVRAYARYLGLDPDKTVQRFQKEAEGPAKSGGLIARAVAPLTHARHPEAEAARKTPQAAAKVDPLAGLARNRKRGKAWSGLLGGIAMLAPLVFAGGILWGGWKLMDHAGVGAVFAGDDPAPVSVTVAPTGAALLERPSAAAYERRVDAYWGAASGGIPTPPPSLTPIDEPLAAALARARPTAETPASEAEGAAESAQAALAPGAAAPAAVPPTLPALPPTAAGGGAFALVARSPVWMEVRDGAGAVVFSGTLQSGQRFTPPEGREGLRLRAGNPSGLVAELDGATLGPLSQSSAVLRDFALTPESLRAQTSGAAPLLAATPAAPAQPRPPAAAAPVSTAGAPAAPRPSAALSAPASVLPPPQRVQRPAAETRVVSNPAPVYTAPDAAPGGRPFGSMRPVD